MSKSVEKKVTPVAIEVTPWFDGGVRPVHIGLYERQIAGDTMCSHWNGERWGVSWKLRDLAFEHRGKRSLFQSAPWRGLAKKPEGAA